MAEQNPKIAVLMATYNGKQWISEQVDSILQQVDVELTLFVSDDGSTDGTLEYLKQLVDSDSRVVLLPKSERMGSAGKNFYRLIRDVDVSGFDYVAFADQDDIWNTNKLSAHVDLIRANDAEAVSSNVMAFWPDGRQKLIVKSQPQQDFDFLFESAGPGCTFVMTPWLVNQVKKQLLANPVAADVELHDWLTYAICRASGKRWVIDSAPSMRYRQHQANVVGANSGFGAFFSRLAKMRQGWYRSQVIKICKVCASLSSDDMYPLILECLQKKHYLSTLRLLPYIKSFRRDPIERSALAVVIILGLF